MARTASAYDLGRHTEQCAATGDALKPGDRVVAALSERSHEEGFDRSDYSEQAWASGARPERLFAYWSSVIPESNAKPNPFIEDDALLGIFEQLAEADDPKHLAFRHLLGLVLIRKRLLVQTGAAPGAEGAGMTLLVRRKDAGPEGDVVEVIDPGLTPQMIADVTEQLGAVLNLET